MPTAENGAPVSMRLPYRDVRSGRPQKLGVATGAVTGALLAGAVLFLLGFSATRVRPASSPKPFAIINVTVIDPTADGPAQAQTVLIVGDRITAAGSNGQVAVPEDATVVDATGKYLIPGLWDMHVHALYDRRPDLFFPLFVTAGITGIRDMGGPPTDFEAIDRLRRRIEAGHLVGPRIVASGPMIDGYPAMFPEMSIAVNNGEEARQAVDSLERKGADFIKVYSLLSRESYFAVADECRRRNLVFAGHVPDSVSVSEASAAGQKSIEHLTAIVLSCSKSEHELRQKLLTARASNDPKRVYDALTAIHTEGLAGYDQSKAHALFQTLARNRTWVAPTLVTARILFSRESLYAGDAEWKESKKLQRWAIDGLSTLRRGTDVSKLEYPPSLFRVVGEMHRAGVEVMAGTDTPNPLAMPGPSLHAELEFLLRCGFSPMEALQAATIKPAEFLGLDDRLGSIQAGKTADLVLLEADPLANIRNVERVFGVVLRGRLLLKSELNDLSASARKAISVHQSASRRLLNGQ